MKEINILNNQSTWAHIPWPKSVTELHVHLGGSVPLYRLWEIAVDRGIRGLGGGYEEFIDLVQIKGGKVKDLDSYLEVYDKVELIQSGPNAVRESIIIALHTAFRTAGMTNLGPGGEGGSPTSLFHLGRIELRLNPLKRTGAVFLKGQHAGLYDVDRVIKAACAAVEDAEISFKNSLSAGLIFCFGRDMTFEANMILAEKTRQWSEKNNSIIGVDLAGAESVNPLNTKKALEEMKTIFKTVGPKLGKTVHAGETKHIDLETFIKTIEALEPQRVAHPIVVFRSLWDKKDDRGLKILKERDIVCEFCVKSNLLTHAVQDLSEYAKILNTLDQYGIRYTFSTDAPALQVTSLAEELILLLENKAATEEQVLRALKTAEDASFLRTVRSS